MRKMQVIAAIAAIVAASCFSQRHAEALGLRLGPFYFHVPFGSRHHHHYAHSSAGHAASLREEEEDSTSTGRTEANQGRTTASPPAGDLNSPLLYPALALPAVLNDIFWPASAPWPFSYETIFRTAFAKVSSDQNPFACPGAGAADVIAGRIHSEVRPAGSQAQPLQKLAGALTVAANYLAKACPKDIPLQPVARLQQMEWQIEKLAEALDIVRQPLTEFQQSLTDAQRVRFAARPMVAAGAGHADRVDAMLPACAVAPTAVDWSVEQISLSVQPTDAQRDAMANVRQAFHSAAGELDANCSTTPPPNPLARLQATEARLDATWRALVSIQTALASLESMLTDEQRVRMDATNFAAAQ